MSHGTTTYLYIQDTMYELEVGYAIAELNSGRYCKRAGDRRPVTTFGLSKDPIVTAGGVQILPAVTIDEVSPEEAAILLLPGADHWLAPGQTPVLEKAGEFLAADVPVAAICGATAGLAQAGFLNDRPHTSNDLGYLQAVCPAYTGAAHYRMEAAITDGNLITATGVAPLEFAYHIIRKLDLFATETLDAWYKLFSTHEPRYFYQLMQSLPGRAMTAGEVSVSVRS